MKTIYINLFGAPSSGKSTLAAGVFYELKYRGESAELVTEIAKEWAWEKRPITNYVDQLQITSTQMRRESVLNGKVHFVVTDSPSLLGSFYEQYYQQTNNLIGLTKHHFDTQNNINIFLDTNRPFRPEGRFEQSSNDATQIKLTMLKWLNEHNITYRSIDDAKPEIVINYLESQINALPKS